MQFRYDLEIEFSEPVTNHSFTVKCVPGSDERQRVLRRVTRILPKEYLDTNMDSFGNLYFFGKAEAYHSLFHVEEEGTVETGLSGSVAAEGGISPGLFRVQTECTRPGKRLKEFFGSLRLSGCADELEKSRRIMEALHGAFAYKSGSTDIGATAEDAFSQGCGVCQDYAHIMLSLCRMAGIPCRYAAGMLMGEGESHAWVEAACRGRWYGLDPTNRSDVLDCHIKFSHGRDYKDCLINRGLFTGGAKQKRSVRVKVWEKEGMEH